MQADEAAPHLRELARFLIPRLPHGLLASSTIKGEGDRAFSRVVRLEEALRHQWISWSTGDWINSETVDCDTAGWLPRLEAAIAAGLPEPAFVVASPWKGSAHLVWLYDRPFRAADPEQARIRKGIRRGLQRALCGDPRFSNRLQKNPWHVRADGQLAQPEARASGDPALWADYQACGAALTYHTEIWRLATVTTQQMLTPLLAMAEAEGVRLLPPRLRIAAAGAPAAIVAIPGVPETDDLFVACARATHRARTADRAIIATIVCRTVAVWGKTVSAGSQSEMVSSISHWMSTKWRGPLDGRGADTRPGKKPVDVGVMTGEAADAGPAALAAWKASTWTERREAAGQRSAQVRSGRSDERIREAVAVLLTSGDDVTQATVAAKAGVSKSTVERRWASLDITDRRLGGDSSFGLICSCGAKPTPPFPFEEDLQSSSLPLFLGEAVRLARIAARRAAKQDAATAAVYAIQANRMKRRGALPEAVSPLSSNASQAVVAAHRSALAARSDAARRKYGREQALRGKQRAAERAAWHVEHVADEAGWAARLDDIAGWKAAAIERDLQRGGDRLDEVELMFRAIYGAEQRARRVARGEPEPIRRRRHRFSEAELATVSW